MGERLKQFDADQVKESLADGCSAALQTTIRPLLKSIEVIGEQIHVYDQQIEEMAKHYPVDLLTPVYGVGTLIALTFVLTMTRSGSRTAGMWDRFWGCSRNSET